MGVIKTFPTWVSHSSIRNYINCPRAYYLINVYKDPISNNRITLINPSLALGQVVHDVLESLALIKSEDRFNDSLIDKYNKHWLKITGELGGFKNEEEELVFKERGKKLCIKF